MVNGGLARPLKLKKRSLSRNDHFFHDFTSERIYASLSVILGAVDINDSELL